MNNQEAIILMQNEITCINRADKCDRDCAKCDLLRDTEELLKAYNMAISAIEKQVARNVQKWENGTNHCPNEDCYYNEFELPYQHEFKYCPECGQKLDWSEI